MLILKLLFIFMGQIKPEMETFAKIKVVGVGGGGGNAISRMFTSKIKGVEFIAINTDAQDLHHALAQKKIHVGKNVTRGLGAGMDPNLGRAAAEENKDEIHEALKGSDMVFITCGLGGGTGTGVSPVVAEIAKETGALTIGVVTKPFNFEGAVRAKIAEEGYAQLRDRVDALITIPNDRVLNIIDKNTSMFQAFDKVDEILKQAVEGIAELITMPGVINVDFADVKAIMKDAGSALMGIGHANGENRAVEAARMAINSPLLDVSIEGAKGVLFCISGGADLGMHEINEAARIITDAIDKDAKVIFGAVHDQRLKKGEVKITVIATGFGAFGNQTPVQQSSASASVFPSFISGPKGYNQVAPKTEKNDVASNDSKIHQIFSKSSESVKTSSQNNAPKSNFFSDLNKAIENDGDEWDVPAFMRRKKK
ncbi:MAG: Cell division protein ftsZ [Parcubacteria group bacterium GW2011_GWC2_36_17]|nr:MAG: Cell division protein ftsZ [Parcubacteria group bacterium GW2011_GWC2_36_17]